MNQRKYEGEMGEIKMLNMVENLPYSKINK